MRQQLAQWLALQPLTAQEVDCATTVMLKILDGKCKMKRTEKFTMEALYDAVRDQAGVFFGREMHALILEARTARGSGGLNQALVLKIYEQRLLAETQLGRPTMKRFKSRIRGAGLFDLGAPPFGTKEGENSSDAIA